MTKDLLGAALRSRLEAMVNRLDASVAPARQEYAAIVAMRNEVTTAEAAVAEFQTNGDPNDDAALQLVSQREAKIKILQRRISQAEERLLAKSDAVKRALAGVDELHVAARFAYMAPHESKLVAILAPYYIDPGQAHVAARATDLIQQFWRGIPRFESESDPIAAAEVAIAKLKCLLDGADPVEVEFKALTENSAASRARSEKLQVDAEREAEAHNQALLEQREEARKRSEAAEAKRSVVTNAA
jgi:hypothetical protein